MIYKAPSIFPTLAGTKWGKVNLDDYAYEFIRSYPNPLLDPIFCASWVNSLAKNNRVDYTFGGYMELRTILWRDSYLNIDNMRHLGIDYNVPSLTPVSVPFECTVAHTYADQDDDGGWGGFVIFDHCFGQMIYGHLAHSSLPKIGTKFCPGDIVARTGVIGENGGWYPHLHVQCHIWSDLYPKRFYSETDLIWDPHNECGFGTSYPIDGYGENACSYNSTIPDPREFIKMEMERW